MKNFSSSDDKRLVQAIKSSNTTAFKALYFRYYESLYNFVWHRTYSVELAKDLLQEVFTRLWQNRQNLDTKKSVKAYLYRIANNLAIDHFRKKTSEKSYLSELSNQNLSSTDESLELQMTIKTAINNLPENLRIIFILSRYQRLKYSEIAEVCKISIKTVESRMSQALQILRKELS